MTAKPRRVLGYARVSSAEQALGTSLEDQQNAIRHYAKSLGTSVTKFYVEAESAIHEKIERRDQMRALMAEVRKGDLVLCDKLDRWSRDAEFTFGSIRKILEAGARFYAIGDACDPSTPEGDTMLGFRVVFAREEHKRIKQRTVGTRNLLRSRGYYAAGVPPLGYRRPEKAANRLEHNVLVIVPEEAELVRTIFRRYLTGVSMTKLAADLGVKLDLVKDALHRRVYLGEVQAPPSAPGRRDGEWIKGRHEAIIDADVFERVQALIAKNRRGLGSISTAGSGETSTWVLRDVARCGHCGGKMAAAYAGPKGERRRHYYRCWRRCQAKQKNGKPTRATNNAFVRVEPVEELAEDLILERLATLRSELAKAPTKPAPKTEDATVDTKREALAKRRARHLEAHAAGLIDLDELRVSLGKVDDALAKLRAEESARLKASPLEAPKARRELLGQLRELERALGHCTPQEARSIVNALAESVALVNGKPPAFVWRSAEALHERFDAIRETLLAGLGRAPTITDFVDAVFARARESGRPLK